MRRVIPLGLISAALLAGCVSVPEKIAEAPTLSSYTLCERLAVGVLADGRIREAWASELQRRGENCSQYSSTIQARQASDIQALQLANQLQQRRPAQSSAPAMTAFLRHNYVSGANRICVYDRGGSQFVTTIPAASICPLSQ